MRRLAARLLAALLPALLLASAPAGAGADLGGLHVDGPPGAWRATNSFRAEWSESSDDPLGFRFLNAPWAVETDWQQGAQYWIPMMIPAPPGATEPPPGEYVVEMWLWSNGSNNPPGPPSYLTLRFDDSAPQPPRPSAPAGWSDGHSAVPLTIEPPPAPLPPSGIRGYAFSVTGDPGQSPCAAPGHCSDAELDLPGAGQSQLTLPSLPDGTSYVNVVAVSGTGIVSPVASAPVRVDATPPTIGFAGVPATWVDHPVAVTALADDRHSGMAPAGPSGPQTALAIDSGPATVSPGGAATAMVSGEGAHLVSAWARDGLGNALAATATPPARVRIDETAPVVAFADAQRPDDPELIQVAVDDALSGPSEERGAIEVRPAGSNQRFERLPTRETAAGLEARWSSDDYPAGSYEFRASGFDAAGNETQTARRGDGTPMVLRNPIKVPTAIESGFGGAKLVWQRCHRVGSGSRRCHREVDADFGSRPTQRTVPYGPSLLFGGILRTAAGAPLAGQPVEVVETFAPGSRASQRRTTVLTRAGGRFEARLAPGPSRKVEAFFAGTRTLTRATGRAVTMAVRAGIRFRASTGAARIGGEPVVFSGRLLAEEARIPRTGRPIELEFRVPGGEWSEFRSVQTDRHGRFRYPYAFTDDDSRGIRFQFRAVSPAQSDWPYRPAASAPVAVTGY